MTAPAPITRVQTRMADLAAAGRKALIPYLMAGDPHPDDTVALMHALVAGGADLIELGVPFSDPMADGPVVQQAGERALKNGVTLAVVLDLVAAFRSQDLKTPVVLMGYANPIERYGTTRFVADAARAGVDGMLVVDYPPEECADFAKALQVAGMDPIFLLAPTSTEARMRAVAAVASGYVYYVALAGVTGAAHLDTDAVTKALPRIREIVGLPIGVGFGIRDARSAAAIGAVADGVVIGSRLIEILHAQVRDNVAVAAQQFMAELRGALDAGEHA